MGLEYLYVRQKLHWVLKDYTLFSATNTTISFVGGLLGIIFVQKLFRISDLAFTQMAFVSLISEFVVKTLAVSTWQMYLGKSLEIRNILMLLNIEPLLNKHAKKSAYKSFVTQPRLNKRIN